MSNCSTNSTWFLWTHSYCTVILALFLTITWPTYFSEYISLSKGDYWKELKVYSDDLNSYLQTVDDDEQKKKEEEH